MSNNNNGFKRGDLLTFGAITGVQKVDSELVDNYNAQMMGRLSELQLNSLKHMDLDSEEYMARKQQLVNSVVNRHGYVNDEGWEEVRLTDKLAMSTLLAINPVVLLDGRPATLEDVVRESAAGDLFRFKKTGKACLAGLFKSTTLGKATVGPDPKYVVKRLHSTYLNMSCGAMGTNRVGEVAYYIRNTRVHPAEFVSLLEEGDVIQIEGFGNRINFVLNLEETEPRFLHTPYGEEDSFILLTRLLKLHLKDRDANQNGDDLVIANTVVNLNSGEELPYLELIKKYRLMGDSVGLFVDSIKVNEVVVPMEGKKGTLEELIREASKRYLPDVKFFDEADKPKAYPYGTINVGTVGGLDHDGDSLQWGGVLDSKHEKARSSIPNKPKRKPTGLLAAVLKRSK